MRSFKRLELRSLALPVRSFSKVIEKKSWKEQLDRSSQMLFMTEIFRGFWLTAEAMAKPKVI